MILTGPQIALLMKNDHLLEAHPTCLHATGIDVHLTNQLLFPTPHHRGAIDPHDPEIGIFHAFDMTQKHVTCRVDHGQFFLGATVEQLNLPTNVSAQFLLSSSLTRLGLSLAAPVWAEPGFQGSLTLPLSYLMPSRSLIMKPYMHIGQFQFHQHRHCGQYSYSHKGRYNGQQYPQPSKGSHHP